MGIFGSAKRKERRKEREDAKDAHIASFFQNQLDIDRNQTAPINFPRATRDIGEIERLKNEVMRLNSTLAKKESELRDAEFSRQHYDHIQERLWTIEILLSQKENQITSLERQLQQIINSSARATQLLQEQRSLKIRELGELNQAYKSLKKELDEKNEACEMLHSEMGILRHDFETYKNRRKREKERLEATEALLSQREGRIAELEREMQENADMVANTRLLLNQSRNEVNSEKRKAHQAAEAVADKNRKMEFLQQECARLNKLRGGGDASTERKMRKEEGQMHD